MTISTTANRISYTGDGVTTAFAFPYAFYVSSDLDVYLAGVQQASGYTVTGGSGSSGTVTFTTAPTSGTLVSIVRSIPYTQLTDLINGDNNDATVQEQALDRGVILSQQLQDAVSRALQQPVSDTAVISPLPGETARASTVLGFDALGNPAVYSPASAVTDAANVTFLASGTGATPSTVQEELARWCWVEQYGGQAGADIHAAVTAAWAAGFQQVRLRNASYNLGAQLTPGAGQGLIGEGKSNTTIVLTADITPFAVTDVNDTFGRGFLVIAYATQTNPILELTAATATITRNDWDDIQVSGSSTDFAPIKCTATGAFGIWNNNARRWSVSGVGTVIELDTSAAGAYIDSNRFEDFYVNNFIKGVNISSSAGSGATSNVFGKWGLEGSSRTTYGFVIPASSAGQNDHNLFDAFTVYDLPSGALYCNIGTGVVGTEIRPPYGVDPSNSYLFVDNGTLTRFTGLKSYAAGMLAQGHFQQIPTVYGWTASVTGSGSTTSNATYNQTRTGTTLNSTSVLATSSTVGGFAGASIFGVDYTKPLVFRFGVGRATAEPNAVGRVQIKTVTAEGALAAAGIGIRVSNYALYGESFGSAGAFVDLSTTLTDTYLYEIEIRHYPGQRIEWWVNGAFAAQTTTTANIPGAVETSYLVHSLVTTVSNPSGDAQMFVFHPALWVDL